MYIYLIKNQSSITLFIPENDHAYSQSNSLKN